jgi:hypothetical protein
MKPQDGPVAISEEPPPSRPVAWRDGARAAGLLAMLAVWTLPPWVHVRAGGTLREASGPARTGVLAALALVAMAGLCLTSLLARRARGLRAGGALTSTALALVTTGVLLAGAAWIPGGDLRQAWVPVFAPLALLAALDAALAALRPQAGHAVSVIRAGAALFAAGTLFVDGSWIPACIALWLGLEPLAWLRLGTAREARRGLEASLLAAALVAAAAPWLEPALVGAAPVAGTGFTVPVCAWGLLALALAASAVHGLARPEARDG